MARMDLIREAAWLALERPFGFVLDIEIAAKTLVEAANMRQC
jgi:hypothetical protein